MARVLIGWELGGGRGHVVSMRLIADALTRRGHEVVLAIQRTDLPIETAVPTRRFQAPIWPGLLTTVDNPPGRVATLFDILARLGLGRPGVLSGMIEAWDSILSASRADVVIGDYAPALTAAARGRLPVIAVGPGFQVPHIIDGPIARLVSGDPGFDEAQLLDTIDADLHSVGRPALSNLSALLAADRPLVASFPQLDPYRRTDDDARFIAPGIDGVPGVADTRGDEVFVYTSNRLQLSDAFWNGLAASRLPIRVHVASAEASLLRRVAAMGISVEARPMSLAQITRRSRITVHHGGHGTICGMLLAGIPQLMLPADLEKQLHSRAADREGLGVMRSEQPLTAEALAEAIRQLWHDEVIADRVRAAAPAFRARMAVPNGESVADMVAALL